MQLNSAEISELIKRRIAQIDIISKSCNEGIIVYVNDEIININCLTEVMQVEMIAILAECYVIILIFRMQFSCRRNYFVIYKLVEVMKVKYRTNS